MINSKLSFWLAYFGIKFLMLWHALLFFWGTIGLVIFLVLVFQFDQTRKLPAGIFLFTILILTSFVYYRLAKGLLSYLDKYRDRRLSQKISNQFLLLFALDACSYFKFFLRGNSPSYETHQGIIDILKGSKLLEIYLWLSKYAPFVYGFFKPEINGSFLLILGLYFLHLSKNEHDRSLEEP